MLASAFHRRTRKLTAPDALRYGTRAMTSRIFWIATLAVVTLAACNGDKGASGPATSTPATLPVADAGAVLAR
jgi:hypothetical protein